MQAIIVKGAVVLVHPCGTPLTAAEACAATMPKTPHPLLRPAFTAAIVIDEPHTPAPERAPLAIIPYPFVC